MRQANVEPLGTELRRYTRGVKFPTILFVNLFDAPVVAAAVKMKPPVKMKPQNLFVKMKHTVL